MTNFTNIENILLDKLINKNTTKELINLFQKIKNSVDLEKYMSVYKWLDDALDGVLSNLIPASANASNKARTVVENTILQRNKVRKQIYPKSFISYIYDPNKQGVGDEYIYTGGIPKNNGVSNPVKGGKFSRGLVCKKFKDCAKVSQSLPFAKSPFGGFPVHIPWPFSSRKTEIGRAHV